MLITTVGVKGFGFCPPQPFFFGVRDNIFVLFVQGYFTVLHEVKTATYLWPSFFFAFFTDQDKVNKDAKNDVANIQPS